MYRRSFLVGLVALAACAPVAPPAPAVANDEASNAVAARVAGAVYTGEWRSGFLYQITFPADLADYTAEVYVIDSDAARTEYRMPARVEIAGSDAKLRFTRLNRVDHLTFADDELKGYTVFNGQQKEAALVAKREGS